MTYAEYQEKAQSALETVLAMPTQCTCPLLTKEQQRRETERMRWQREHSRMNLHFFDRYFAEKVID